jgi:hypothetical protein
VRHVRCVQRRPWTVVEGDVVWVRMRVRCARRRVTDRQVSVGVAVTGVTVLVATYVVVVRRWDPARTGAHVPVRVPRVPALVGRRGTVPNEGVRRCRVRWRARCRWLASVVGMRAVGRGRAVTVAVAVAKVRVEPSAVVVVAAGVVGVRRMVRGAGHADHRGLDEGVGWRYASVEGTTSGVSVGRGGLKKEVESVTSYLQLRAAKRPLMPRESMWRFRRSS